VLVTETDSEAADYLADPDNGLSFYYTFFHFSFSRGRKALFMLKPDLELPDEDVTMDMIKRTLIIAGTPGRVLDQLVALREETGHFGTLLMGGHDWDQPALWRRSMELLATDVMPVRSPRVHARNRPGQMARETVELDPEKSKADAAYKLLIGRVVPRPIAWCRPSMPTAEERGPFSLRRPRAICRRWSSPWSGRSRRAPRRRGRHARNVEATGSFVVNVATDLADR
jgi:hypothetical protein